MMISTIDNMLVDPGTLQLVHAGWKDRLEMPLDCGKWIPGCHPKSIVCPGRHSGYHWLPQSGPPPTCSSLCTLGGLLTITCATSIGGVPLLGIFVAHYSQMTVSIRQLAHQLVPTSMCGLFSFLIDDQPPVANIINHIAGYNPFKSPSCVLWSDCIPTPSNREYLLPIVTLCHV